jgi:hypothetical protein
MDSDGKAEIFVANPDNDTVFIYRADGKQVKYIQLPWDFKGVRLTGPGTGRDIFMVADVFSDGMPEIVIIEWISGSHHSNLRLWDVNTESCVPGFEIPTSGSSNPLAQVFHCHAACIGGMSYTSELDLLVATTEGMQNMGPKIQNYDFLSRNYYELYYWPIFSEHDTLVSGNIMNRGKDQIIVVSRSDNTVYVGAGKWK